MRIEDADTLAARIAGARHTGEVAQSAPDPDSLAPVLLDLGVLATSEPHPPRFIVEGWLPEGQATLFAGHGGAGKSLVALTVSVCVAAGRAVFGLRCERRRVLFLSYEDNDEVLHWRLRRVCDMLGIDLAELKGWLFAFDASAAGGPLYVETREGHGLSADFDWLREKVAEHGAQVAVIDGTADAFAGNENNRAQVRAFVQALRRLIPRDGAVALLHHVDATSAHGGSHKGYSGSTAWHNSCRARWYLLPENDSEGDDADDDTQARVLLELRKSNHGKPGASLLLRFNDSAGCFVLDAEPVASPLDRALRESDDREAVLRLIREADDAGDPIPASTGGPRTCWHVLSAQPSFPDSLKRAKDGRRRLLAVIEKLRAAKAIRVDTIKSTSRNTKEVLRAA